MALCNTSIAKYVSANLAIIMRTKIDGDVAALLHTVATRIDTFS
jgi:hypothetical protein